MNTWTFKGPAAVCACLALTACDDAAFLSGGQEQVQALTSATLEGGRIAIDPPDGFCIDRTSLQRNFALLARCDTLGGTGGAAAPLAVITATSVAASASAAAPSAQAVGERAGETVLRRADSGPLSLVQVRGTPPGSGMNDVFWRGTGRVGNHIIGLAIYPAQDGGDLGDLAPQLLSQTLAGLRDTAPAQDNSATTAANPAADDTIAGLSE